MWRSHVTVNVGQLGRLRDPLNLAEGCKGWVMSGQMCATPGEAAASHDLDQVFLELQARSGRHA